MCKLAAQEASSNAGPWVCPISGLEVTGQSEVYCPQRIRGRGSRPDTFSHTITPTRRRPSQKKSRSSETRRFVTMLLASQESEALILASATRRERGVTAAVVRAGSSFMAQMIRARNVNPRGALPPVNAVMLSSLAGAIDDFLDRVRDRLVVCKGNASLVAAVVGFLATGISSGSITLFPRVPWVAQRLPAAADLGKLPGFQCRPVSISARHIKAAVFGTSGGPISSLLFRLPPGALQSHQPQHAVGLVARVSGAANVDSFGNSRPVEST